MEYSFSDRISSLKPSAIREILKSTSDPSVISLAAGNPAPEAFPVSQIKEIIDNIMTSSPISALQYSVTEGYAPFIKTITEYMRDKHNSVADFDNVIITSGAQQVMDIATKSLCNEGDTVICESPSFIGSLNTFRSYNVKLCGVPLESDGMNIDALEKALKSEKRVKFIYTIPNFQNPSGVTMSLDKRKAVYDLAKKYGVMILEDNPYGDIRFEGEHIPNIKSFDSDGIVIYAGSFSKVLSPGIRVGYAIAPAPLISKMTICKQTSDVHTAVLQQMVADKFMREYDYEGHLEKIREIYRKKAKLLFDLADTHLRPIIDYQKTEGGLFLWCALPQNIDMMSFCKKAVDNKVAVVPGNAFLTNENEYCNNFRINYSTPTNEQLTKGMEILGKIAKEI